ncbi:SRPBCC family protein [Dictyobacter formicarum]|nr:SRPBCC domain-containing protein [Dictyobacter formicarum]
MENNFGHRSIEKELFINATPERVFQALTEKAELERWFAQTAELDLRPGGAISFYWGPGVFESGQMVALAPPHRLSYTWEAMEPSPVTITFQLNAENDGTRLRLVQTGIGEGKDWDHYYHLRNNGWNVHLTHLTTWLETGICPSPGPIKRPS